MNPSFPFIAAPYEHFQAFKKVVTGLDISTEYNLTCTSLDWCYFKTNCSNVEPLLPDLVFHLGSGAQKAKFKLSPQNYLFSEINKAKRINNCHLAVIGQDFSNVNYWILGDIFNYNFYTSFDAENTPRVGLALPMGAGTGATITPIPEAEEEVRKSKFLVNTFFGILVTIVFTMLLYVICRCHSRAKHNAAVKRVAEYEARKRLEAEEDGEYVMSSGSQEDNYDSRSEPMLAQPATKVSFSIFENAVAEDLTM